MGPHGIGAMNENGELFGDLCGIHNLIIGGTLFPHKTCHKVTWVSPDGFTQNQIDHIAISRNWKSSLLDCRNRRGADIDSDHYLVVAEIRLKIAATQSKRKPIGKRYDVQKLRNPETKNQFLLCLRNNFSALQEDENLDESWVKIQHAFTTAGKQVLGYSKLSRKPWMSQDLWSAIEQRQNTKRRLIEEPNCELLHLEYSSYRKKIKKIARRDKRLESEEIAERAKNAALTRDSHELYKATRQLSNPNKRNNRKPLRDRNGNLLCTTEEQLSRWHEHFCELLSRYQCTPEKELLDNAAVTLDIPVAQPSFDEINKAIRQLKNGKAPGIDNISAEMLKVDPNISASMLYPLIERIWHLERIPSEWKQGLLVKVPKKGNLSLCDNWRGITILPVASKILAKILLNRMSERLEETFREEQAGFRPNRSCIDHINTIRILIEQCVEWQSQLYLTFVDFEKAFDTVNWSALWSSLNRRGVPLKLINIIKDLYHGSTSRVVHDGALSLPIEITSGVKQGCLLSPLLFILLIDDVMRRVTTNPRGIPWNDRQLEDLDYADDLVLISDQLAHIHAKLKDLQQASTPIGLRINTSKTVEMRINPASTESLYLGDHLLEQVEEFCYLGSIISPFGGAEADIDNRIKKAKAAFARLRSVWKSNILSRRIKLSLYESLVKSVLLYGCETWKTTKSLINRVQVFLNRCLRSVLKIYWPNTITNNKLWEICRQHPADKEISLRRWRWVGHILRREAGNAAQVAFQWQPAGRRRPGRPTNTWRRSVEADLKGADLSWNHVLALAKDRTAWKSVAAALCSTKE